MRHFFTASTFIVLALAGSAQAEDTWLERASAAILANKICGQIIPLMAVDQAINTYIEMEKLDPEEAGNRVAAASDQMAKLVINDQRKKELCAWAGKIRDNWLKGG